MNKYRWDRESSNMVTVSSQHRMLSASHGHYEPAPPTPIHYLCKAPKVLTGTAKITYIETCSKQKPPIGDIYFFENPLGHAKMHDFAHYKRVSVYPKQGLKFCTGILTSPPHCYTAYTDATVLTNAGFGSIEYPSTGLQSMFVNTVSGDFAPPPSGLDTYIQRSLECMLPGIKPALSLPNSLLELKDMKSVPKTIKNLTTFLSLAGKFIAGKKGMTMKVLLKTLADAHLQVSFNVMPLLSDISGIIQTMRNTEKELAQLIARQHKVQKKHFRAFMGDSYQDSDSGMINATKTYPGSGHPPVFGNAKAQREVKYSTREFHAEIWYSYWLGTAELEQARIRAYLDKLGVNLDPSIIWNAIPWSFVVDWFVGIGPWLSQFTSRNIEPVVIIHRYLYSFKVARNITLSGMIEPIDGHHGGASSTQAMHNEVLYKRTCGMPDIYRALQTSGLNSKEFLLGASLSYLRWRR